MRKGSEKIKINNKAQILINNFHPYIKSPVPCKNIRNFVTELMNGEGCDLKNLDINLIENSEIKRINRKFLNHNYYTDIITFPYSIGKSGIEGELFISLDEVKSNSLSFSEPFKNEFMRVIIHGCLHLTGYNDKTRKQKELIKQKENFYMCKIGKRT